MGCDRSGSRNRLLVAGWLGIDGRCIRRRIGVLIGSVMSTTNCEDSKAGNHRQSPNT